MEPILKRRVGSVLQALEEATCSTFNLQDLETEIADIMAPTAAGLPKKSELSTKEEPVIIGDNFSFVRNKQEYIPGLSIPQDGESKPADSKLNFLATGQSKQYQKPNYTSTDVRYRDFGFSRGNYNHHRFQQNRSPRGQDKDTPFKSFDQRVRDDRFSRRDFHESRPSTSGYNERRSETSEVLTNQERQSVDQGPFTTHAPPVAKSDGSRSDSRPGRGFEGGGPRRFENRNYEGGRQFDNRGRGAEGGRHYDNRGRGGEGGRFYNNRGGNEGGRYFDNRNRSESRGSSAERGSVSGFGSNFGGSGFRGARGGFDRGRGNRRNNRRKKMTPEEDEANAKRMLARDAEAERRIRAAAEMPPPDKPAT